MEKKLEVTEMLDLVDYNTERAEQEAREEEELLLLNMDGSPWTLEFDECPADKEYKRFVAEDMD